MGLIGSGIIRLHTPKINNSLKESKAFPITTRLFIFFYELVRSELVNLEYAHMNTSIGSTRGMMAVTYFLYTSSSSLILIRV